MSPQTKLNFNNPHDHSWHKFTKTEGKKEEKIQQTTTYGNDALTDIYTIFLIKIAFFFKKK